MKRTVLSCAAVCKPSAVLTHAVVGAVQGMAASSLDNVSRMACSVIVKTVALVALVGQPWRDKTCPART